MGEVPQVGHGNGDNKKWQVSVDMTTHYTVNCDNNCSVRLRIPQSKVQINGGKSDE